MNGEDRVQVNHHTNPLSKEGLVGAVIEIKEKLAGMSNDMDWVKESLKRIEQKIETKADDEELAEIKKTLMDHERRLRIAERHNYTEIGIAMLGSALLSSGIILAILKYLLGL